MIIRRLGHEPYFAADGIDALYVLADNHLNGTPIDLLLCDHRMPRLSGEELIVKMRQRGIFTPVLVISGVGDKDLVVRLMRLGCRDFLDKPFSAEEIEKRVSILLDDACTRAVEENRREYFARVGEVAQATAHDMNNALCTTLGYTEMLMEQAPTDEPTRERLSKLSTSVNRTAEICRELLAIDPNASQSCRQRTDLSFLVERVSTMLRDILPDSIEIETTSRGFPVWFAADAWLFQHALLNLGFNAADAMPNGGKISLDLRFIEPGTKSPSEPGRQISITIADTGVGIAPDVLPRIFDDRYSTKRTGHGIGLANVKNAVEQHGGSITVQSAAGTGTQFTILLPV